MKRASVVIALAVSMLALAPTPARAQTVARVTGTSAYWDGSSTTSLTVDAVAATSSAASHGHGRATFRRLGSDLVIALDCVRVWRTDLGGGYVMHDIIMTGTSENGRYYNFAVRDIAVTNAWGWTDHQGEFSWGGTLPQFARPCSPGSVNNGPFNTYDGIRVTYVR